MPGTAAEVLSIAAKELGVTESPPGSNRTKYGAWYGLDGNPWCAMFCSWVLDQAGVTGYRHSYTPSGVALFKDKGAWHTTGPKPGDLVYFDFPDSTYRVQHVGFVVKDNGNGTIDTIEGNTSSGSSGSQDNGGGVFARTRSKSSSGIVGYGRPGYKAPDVDYMVFGPNRKWRFEKQRLAMQKVRALIRAGKKATIKPIVDRGRRRRKGRR